MEILVCPMCKGKLGLEVEKQKEQEIIDGLLTCANCKVNYAIGDGIPTLLPPAEKRRDIKTDMLMDKLLERANRPFRRNLDRHLLNLLLPYQKGFTLNLGCGPHICGDVRLDVVRSDATNIIADARYLPFKNDCFDTVLALSVLHHIPDYDKTIAEMVRICRGSIIGWEPNIFHPYVILWTYLLGLTNERPLNPFKFRRYLENRGADIHIWKTIIGLKILSPLLGGSLFPLLIKSDRIIPPLFRGFFLYVVSVKDKIRDGVH